MRNSYNKVFRDKKKLEEMLELRRGGASTIELGKKYGVDHSSIVHHCMKNNIHIDSRKYRNFVSTSIEENHIKEKNQGKTYLDYLKEEERKKNERREKCQHRNWIKRCSCCGTIIESL